MVLFSTLPMLASTHDWGGPGWHGGWFFPLVPLLWIVLVGVVVWLITRRRRPDDPSGLERARARLAERYADGALSTEEYRERLDNLR